MVGLFPGIEPDDFELIGQDAGEDFDDLMARERSAGPVEVVSNGGVDLLTQVFPSLFFRHVHVFFGLG